MVEAAFWIGLGHNQNAVLDYIRYPRVVALSFNTMQWSEANEFYSSMTDDVKNALGNSGVDDDIAYYLTANSLGDIDSVNRVSLMDLQRGWGSSTMLSLDTSKLMVRTDDEISCAIFNGARAARPNKWSVDIGYSDGSKVQLWSGVNDRDVARNGGGHIENSYFDNGRIRIPNPPGWPAILYNLKSFDKDSLGMGAKI